MTPKWYDIEIEGLERDLYDEYISDEEFEEYLIELEDDELEDYENGVKYEY